MKLSKNAVRDIPVVDELSRLIAKSLKSENRAPQGYVCKMSVDVMKWLKRLQSECNHKKRGGLMPPFSLARNQPNGFFFHPFSVCDNAHRYAFCACVRLYLFDRFTIAVYASSCVIDPFLFLSVGLC